MDVLSLLEVKKQKKINVLAVLYVSLCKMGVHMSVDDYLDAPLPRITEIFSAAKHISEEEDKQLKEARSKGRLRR